MRQKISVFCPTRNRISMLDRYIKNIFEKGSEKLKDNKFFELLIAVDDDDFATIEFYNQNFSNHETIKMLTRERSKHFTKDYWTFSCEQSSGDLIWAGADDVEIFTDNWDEVLLNKVNKFESLIKKQALDNYFYNWEPNELEYLININCSDGDFERYDFLRCSFPILTREAFNKLGFFVPHEWMFWGADYALGEIFRKAGKVFSLGDIKVGHWTYTNANENFDREKDITNQETEETSKNCQMANARYKKQENIIDAYSQLLMKKDKMRYEPSKISLESIKEPQTFLYKEITFIAKEAEELAKLGLAIVIECPKCKFENYHLIETELPMCPVHKNPALEYNIKSNLEDDPADEFSEYEVELKCPDCDYLVDLENAKTFNSCPNPKCDYEGKLDILCNTTVDFRLKHSDLTERWNRLVEKYAALHTLLENKQ